MNHPVEDMNNIRAELAFDVSPTGVDPSEVVTIDDDIVVGKGMVTFDDDDDDVGKTDVPSALGGMLNSPTSVAENYVDDGNEQRALRPEKENLKKGFLERFLDSWGLDEVCGIDDDTLIQRNLEDDSSMIRRNLSFEMLHNYCHDTYCNGMADPFVGMDEPTTFLQLDAYGEATANESYPPKELKAIVVHIDQGASVPNPVLDFLR